MNKDTLTWAGKLVSLQCANFNTVSPVRWSMGNGGAPCAKSFQHGIIGNNTAGRAG